MPTDWSRELLRDFLDGYQVHPDGEILQPWGRPQVTTSTVNGYRVVRLHTRPLPPRGGVPKWRTFTLARVVAFAFHGAPPTPDAVVRYRDGDKENVRAENLFWSMRRNHLTKPDHTRETV